MGGCSKFFTQANGAKVKPPTQQTKLSFSTKAKKVAEVEGGEGEAALSASSEVKKTGEDEVKKEVKEGEKGESWCWGYVGWRPMR